MEIKTGKGLALSGHEPSMYWMLLGNLAPILCAWLIAIGVVGRFSSFASFDIIFGLMVILIAATKYVDIEYLWAKNVYGSLESMSHFCAYLRLLGIGSLGLWLLIHAISIRDL